MTSSKLLILLSAFFLLLIHERTPAETKGFSYIRSVLLAEGIKDSSKLEFCRTQYEALLAGVRSEVDPEDDIYDQNEDIFEYLHKNYLLKYSEECRLNLIFENKHYNCVSASVLYYAICQDLNINIKIYTTPYHVFLKIFHKGKPVRIDLTDPSDGFDFKEYKEEVIKSLLDAKMVTQDEIWRRGMDSIYSDFVEETREITPLNLTQIVMGNMAIRYMENKKYDLAFSLAYDSYKLETGNKNAEKTLYAIWNNSTLEYVRTSELDKIDTLLRYMFAFKDLLQAEYKKSMLIVSVPLIEEFISHGRGVDEIDSLCKRIKSALGNEPGYESMMLKPLFRADLNKVRSLMIKGYYQQAYELAGKLYRSPKKKMEDVREVYMLASKLHISSMIRDHMFQPALALADSLIKDAPDYPVVQELYITTVMVCILGGRLYWTDPAEAERWFNKAVSLAPGSTTAKNAKITLFHEYAMAMVRENDYNKAKKLILEGLKIDPEATLLRSDMQLISKYIK